jgi:hypothetical protein
LAPAARGTNLTLSGILDAATAAIANATVTNATITNLISTSTKVHGLSIGIPGLAISTTEGQLRFAGSAGVGYGGNILAHDGVFRDLIYNALTHKFQASGTGVVNIDSAAIKPQTAAGVTVGTTTLPFGPMFARGLAVGHNTLTTPGNGEIQLTNSSNLGTVKGYGSSYGDLALDGDRVLVKLSGTTQFFFSTNQFYPSLDATVDIGALSNRIRYAYATRGYIPEIDAATIAFRIAGSEKARVHSNGFMGVGSTSPTAPMTIRNNWIASIGQIRLESADYAGWCFYDTSNNVKASNYFDIVNGGWTWTGASTNPRIYGFDVAYGSQVALFAGPKTTVSYDGTNTHFTSNGYYTGAAWARRAAVASVGMFSISDGGTLANYPHFFFYENTNTTATAGSAFGPGPVASLGHTPLGLTTAALWFNNVSPASNNYTLRTDTNGTTYLESTVTNADIYIRHVNNLLARTNIGSAFAWDVAGACHASSFPTSSDRRFKDNIEELPDALDRVMQIPVVTFDWNDLHRNKLGRSKQLTGKQLGVIAQDVAEVAPWVVTRWSSDEDGGRRRTDKENLWHAVDYGRLGVLTLGGLQQYVRQTDPRLEALEAEVKELRALLGKAA